MTRFSVSLSDELSEWVEDRASSRNVSKAQVIRDAVELAKESDAAKGGDISVVQSGEVIDRLDELETRVEKLESRSSQSAVRADSEARIDSNEATDTTGTATDAAESAGVTTERDSTDSSGSGSNALSSSSSMLYEGVSDDVASAVEDVAESWEDEPERLRARKNAAAKVLQHALNSGDAVGKSSDIVEKVREMHPVEGQKDETYYRKNIRPILKEYGSYSQGHHGYIVSDDWYTNTDGWADELPDLSDEE